MAAILNARTGYRNGTTSGWVARSLFSVGDNLYAVVLDTSAVKIRVYKGTGDGTWTEQDAANAPLHSGATDSYDAAIPLSGTAAGLIHVAYRTATTTVNVRRFNTTTDSWETSDVGAGLAGLNNNFPVRLAIRSDGDVIVVYLRSSDQWMYFICWEGTSWSGATPIRFLPENLLDAVMTADSDRVHVYREDSAGAGSRMQNSVRNTNSLGPNTVVDSSSLSTFSSFGAYVDDGGTHRVGIAARDADGSLSFYHLVSSVEATSGVAGLSPTTTTDPSIMGGAVAPYSGQWHVVWSGNGRGEIHYDVSDDYASPAFGTDSTIVSALSATDPAVYATSSATGVPVLYTDMTDPPAVDIVWAAGAPAASGPTTVTRSLGTSAAISESASRSLTASASISDDAAETTSILNARTGYRNGTTSGWAARSLFNVGDNLYAVVLDTSAVKIRVYKGTGDGTWVEQDSSNAPSHSGESDSYDAAMPLSGPGSGYVYVAYRPSSGTPLGVAVRRFNTASDTWESADVGGANAASTSDPTTGLSIAIRSDGDVLLIFTQLSPTRCYLVVYEGTAWSGTTNLRGNYNHILSTSMRGSTDNLHLFRKETVTTGIYRNIIAPDNTNSASTSVDTTTAAQFSNFSAYASDAGADLTAVAFRDATGELDLGIGVDADLPTVVASITPTTVTDPGVMGSVLVAYNSQWHVIWSGNGRGEIHYDTSDDYASPVFGTDSTIVSGLSATDPAVYAIATATGVPVLYTDLTSPPAVDIVWAAGAPAVAAPTTITRSLGASVAVSETETRSLTASVAVSDGAMRTLGSSAAISTVVGRSLAASASILAGQVTQAISDDSIDAWTDESGSTTSLYNSISDDLISTYIQSSDAPSNDTARFKLALADDPNVSDEHSLWYRIGSTVDGTGDLTVRLVQGLDTEIAFWFHPDLAQESTTIVQELSGSQTDAITNYSDLYIEFTATNPVWEDLGQNTNIAAVSTANGRIISGLQYFNDRVYLAYGDYDLNQPAGGGKILSWDTTTEAFVDSGVVLPAYGQDIRLINDELWYVGNDPAVGTHMSYGVVTSDHSATVLNFGAQLHGFHLFDAVVHKNKPYLCGAAYATDTNSNGGVWRFDAPNWVKVLDVPGTDPLNWRIYTMFDVGEELLVLPKDGSLHRSGDGGTTWAVGGAPFLGTTVTHAISVAGACLYRNAHFPPAFPTHLFWTDGVTQKTPILQGTIGSGVVDHCISSDHIPHFVTNNGSVYRGSPDGLTWIRISDDGPANASSICVTNDTIYVGTKDSHLWRRSR